MFETTGHAQTGTTLGRPPLPQATTRTINQGGCVWSLGGNTTYAIYLIISSRDRFVVSTTTTMMKRP